MRAGWPSRANSSAGQAGLPRPQAPRYRQYRRGGRALRGSDRREPSSPSTPIRRRCAPPSRESWLAPEDPRRDGADVLRRCGPRRRGIRARRRRPRGAPRRSGAGPRHRRHRLRPDGSRRGPRAHRPGPSGRDPRHPARRARRRATRSGCLTPVGRHPRRREPSRGRSSHHGSGRSEGRGRGDRGRDRLGVHLEKDFLGHPALMQTVRQRR